MEVDTGAAISVISKCTYDRLFPNLEIVKPSVRLKTYTGEAMKLIGEITAEAKYGEQSHTLSLMIVDGNGPSLLGRDWLHSFTLDWKHIASMKIDNTHKELDKLLTSYSEVFEDKLGPIRHFEAKLRVKEGATPKFHKPRNVPFSMKEKISKELDRLEAEGVIENINYSEWAAPLVPVPKPDGRVRLCGDYKVTINPVLEVDRYPLPRPEDLFATLTGGQRFTKLDLKQAYLQMVLDNDSRRYATINTHQGLYQFTRVPFGIAPAPAVFQKMMDTILQGMTKVICYIDDVLVTGSNDQEHLANLAEVLKRMKHHDIRLKRSKCRFLQDSVEYLGHVIDRNGLHTSSDKVEAVLKAPRPKNVRELQAFLGSIHYYGKFMQNLSTLLHPLNELLKNDTRWNWTEECEKAFEEAKQKLMEAKVLAHYNPDRPLRLAADASAYGIGAVISHVLSDGTEHPIAYASCTLTKSEQNYAQLEKEALSLIFGINKFHSYLYGRKFVLYTDHKPLTTILGPKQGIPPLAASRLQRWALILAGYDYKIEYKSTTAHANADMLSRLPIVPSKQTTVVNKTTMLNIQQIETLPFNSDSAKELY